MKVLNKVAHNKGKKNTKEHIDGHTYYYCCICGRKMLKPIRSHHRYWCNKHYKQSKKNCACTDDNCRTIYDKNEIRIKNDIAEMDVYDHNGNVVATTIFDADDVNKVRDTKWRLSHGYIMSSHRFLGSINQFHKIVKDASTNEFVDHVNHNTLDNRKCNLRIVSKSQNAMNSNFNYNTNTPRGISLRKDGRYYAYIKIQQKMLNLGIYTELEEAMYARWYAEVLLFKEYRYKKNKPQILQRRECEIQEYVNKKVQRL